MNNFGQNHDYGKSQFADKIPIPFQFSVLSLIQASLRILGVVRTGENADSQEVKDAIEALNTMLREWDNERTMVPCLQNQIFDVTPGKSVYTIGLDDTADFYFNRPLAIEKAFTRFLGFDYPCEIISNDKYQDIFAKTIQSTFPKYLFYNPTYQPVGTTGMGRMMGTISFWPAFAQSGCSVNLTMWTRLLEYASPSEKIFLPEGYEAAIKWNLAVELSREYGKEPTPFMEKRAMQTKDIIMAANTDEMLMRVDSNLMPTRSLYNIYNDTFSSAV
jgi:hypothetical protein